MKEIENFEPFLGRIVIEMIREDTVEYMKKQYGMQADSPLALPEDLVKSGGRVPYKKGRVVKMAKDTFGQRFKDRYGLDGNFPQVGDVLVFIPFESFKLTNDDKYHLIADEDIVGFYKGESA